MSLDLTKKKFFVDLTYGPSSQAGRTGGVNKFHIQKEGECAVLWSRKTPGLFER